MYVRTGPYVCILVGRPVVGVVLAGLWTLISARLLVYQSGREYRALLEVYSYNTNTVVFPPLGIVSLLTLGVASFEACVPRLKC